MPLVHFCRPKGYPMQSSSSMIFRKQLEPQSFDLVHARYQIAPLGRGPEQVDHTGGWSGRVDHWFWRSGTWARGTSILVPPRPSDWSD